VPTQKKQELQRATSLTKKKLELRRTADQQRTNFKKQREKKQDEDHASTAGEEGMKIESCGRGGVQEVACRKRWAGRGKASALERLQRGSRQRACGEEPRCAGRSGWKTASQRGAAGVSVATLFAS
jgi:hypothetical protein